MKTNHITALGIMLCSFADHVRYKLVFENDTDTNSCLGPIFKGKMANTHDNTEPENFIQLYIWQYRPGRTVRASVMVLERDGGSCFLLFCDKLDGNSCLGPILKETMANNHNNSNPDVSKSLYIWQNKPHRTVRASEIVIKWDWH